MTIAQSRTTEKDPGADRPRGGDGRPAAGTDGGLYGANGRERRTFWIAYAVFAAFIVCIDVVNILTVLDDRAELDRPVPAWEPTVWEFTSGISTLVWVLALYPLVVRLLGRARGWGQTLAVHAVAIVTFSLLHVSSMVMLRGLIYAAVGGHYPLSLAEFPYELRKDGLTYLVAASLFWLWRRQAIGKTAPSAARADAAATFDIRDGARILRTPVAEIRAAGSAGNYVEFELADGRKPLMRATLSSIEAALEAHGFVRTHRSWLVNPAAVRAISPEGSGDFELELEGGRKVPLSRRFPDALKRLRG